MAATSKTAGGRKITDENRAAMRARARAYAAKGKPRIRAKDMPYGWALPKGDANKPAASKPATAEQGKPAAANKPIASRTIAATR